MAHCPNCGKDLHLYNWKPNCPQCGVNLVYFNSNERLLEESEKAEIEHALHQPGVDRAKASTIGSKLGIARIIISVLPLAAAFLPLVKVFAQDGSSKLINALKLYNNFISPYGFGNVFGDGFGGKLIPLSVSLLLIALVLSLLLSLLLVMSLGKHGKLRNLIIDLVLLGLSSGSAVCFALGAKDLSSYSESVVSGKLFIGIFVIVGLHIVRLVFNLYLANKGLPEVKYTTCYIGGIPSDEYFKMVENGVSQLEIRKKMVEILTVAQEECHKKDAEARAKEQAEEEERRNRRKK